MASTSLPTILLIPGAFTTPDCFDWLAPKLEKAGHPVVLASLISCNPQDRDPKSFTAEEQGLDLFETRVQPLVEEKYRDVLIFAHSFGATSCSGYNSSITKPERSARGLPGGVIGIVYMACALVRDGETQLEHMGGTWPSFCKTNHPKEGLVVFDPVVDTLWNDLKPELQQDLLPTHLPHALRPLETPVKDPLWKDAALHGRRVYTLTKQDHAFPMDVQKEFVTQSMVHWEIVEIDAGHAAFIGKAEEVAEIILEAAREWKRASIPPPEPNYDPWGLRAARGERTPPFVERMSYGGY